MKNKITSPTIRSDTSLSELPSRFDVISQNQIRAQKLEQRSRKKIKERERAYDRCLEQNVGLAGCICATSRNLKH